MKAATTKRGPTVQRLGRARIIRQCGAEPRVENPTKADLKLAAFVVRHLCTLGLNEAEREVLKLALVAFGKVTDTGLGSAVYKGQAVCVAAAYARQMKKQGDTRGIEARDHLSRVVDCLFSGDLRSDRATLADYWPPHGWTPPPVAADIDAALASELGDEYLRFLGEEGGGL